MNHNHLTTNNEVESAVQPTDTDTRPGGLHDAVLYGIGRSIISGEYPVGEVLPHETILSARYTVGRNSLREVFKVLSSKGLIESVRKAGTIVLPTESWDLFDPLVIRWAVDTPLLDQIVRSLTEARQVIEPEAAYRAAERATGKDIYLIEEALAEMTRDDPEDDAFFSADLSFHLAVLRASHNPLWLKFGLMLSEALVQSFRRSQSVRDIDTILRGHRLVSEAIRMRNPEQARAAMQSLLGQTRTFLHIDEEPL